MIPRFKKSRFEPKPIETDYWIDLNENEYGGVFKYYDNNAMIWKLTEAITKEREPLFTNSPAFKITTNDIDYWNNKVDYEDFDVLKEELLDLGSQFEGVTIETLEYYNDILRSDINNDLNNKADKSSVYTRQQVDTKFAEWKVELPENVSYFKNDAGYVTESNLEEKLPDNIVSDANYVHTDNNFNNSYKSKLDGLTEDLKAIEYDDTEVKNLINQNTARINALQTSVEEDIANIEENISSIEEAIVITVESMSEEIAKKANADEVYTKQYLDEVFTQFVRKTHKTYGYIDDRPTTDLTADDTGFIFYDYTVNEALLWVADEWRLLRTNEALTNFIKDEDIVRQVTDWEWEDIENTEFRRLIKYTGEYSSTMDLTVPNVYINKFVTKLGRDYSNIGEPMPFLNASAVTRPFTDALGRLITFKRTILIEPEYFMGYPVEKLISNPQHKVYDVFGTVMGEAVDTSKITRAFEIRNIDPLNNNPVPLNNLSLSLGIRYISDGMFANIIATNTVLDIPAGVEKIGDYAFYKSNITEITFPRNPVKLGAYAFYNCPLSKVTFPKTLDWDYIKHGGGSYCFAYGTSKIDIILPEGVKAIPNLAFRNTLINSLKFPDSLEHIGYGAFYNGHSESDKTSTLTFKSKNVKTIQSWAFRNVNFSSIDLTGVETLNPYAFYWNKSGGNPCTSLIMGPTIKNINMNSWPTNLINCAIDIALPETLKTVEANVLLDYGRSVANNGLDIKIAILDGVEALCYQSIYNTGFNTTISLPKSLKYIASYALGKNVYLKNESLFIPKNVRIITGTSSDWGGDWFYELEEDKELYDKVFPLTKNGYGPKQLKEYIEDGGTLAEYGHGAFYQFAPFTLKEFIVDEENEWFKSIDGVLFSKDGKRLISYPSGKGVETYEIPEGCEYADCAAFNFTGYKTSWTWENKNGETVDVTYDPGTTIPSDKNSTILKTIILPNTFINYSPYEILEKWPTASQGHVGNILAHMTWWYTHVERILVKEDNPLYKNDGDWLLSKDGTVLLVILPGMKGTYRIPDSVTTIAPGAFIAWNSVQGKEVTTDYTAAKVTPTTDLANDSYVKRYSSIKLVIPPSVVNISDLVLYSLNLANKNDSFHLVFEDGNPAFTYNSETGNYERV